MRFDVSACAMLLAFLLACSDREADPADSDSARTAAPDSSDPAAELEEEDVENFIGAMTELRKLGADLEGRLGENPSDARQFMTALGARNEWLEVIDDHGLDRETFAKVQASIVKAFVALESAGPAGDIQELLERNKTQLEAIKAKLPPEALEQMEAGSRAAAAQFEALMADIPEANLELVRKYRDKLQAVLR